jgi:hypothetical protein
MTREQLEHLIRAAAVIAADDSIVVIGPLQGRWHGRGWNAADAVVPAVAAVPLIR